MERYFQPEPREPPRDRLDRRLRRERAIERTILRGWNEYRKPSPTRLSRIGERSERSEETREELLRETGSIRQAPGTQAPGLQRTDKADGRGETLGDHADFFVKEGAVWVRWRWGGEERVGRTPDEIATWFRELIKKDTRITTDEDYNALIDWVFGEDDE